MDSLHDDLIKGYVINYFIIYIIIHVIMINEKFIENFSLKNMKGGYWHGWEDNTVLKFIFEKWVVNVWTDLLALNNFSRWCL